MSWEVSISAVVGRIDQIIQLQQQILDPRVPPSRGSAPAAARVGVRHLPTAPRSPRPQRAAATGTGTSSDFASLSWPARGPRRPRRRSPLRSSASGVVGTTASGLAGTSGGVGVGDPRVSAMVNEANSLVGKPYVYGGGHSGWGPQTGYDCSGFVSAVLHAGGYLTSPVDTTALPSQPGMVSGPGQYVTVYDRALPGQNGHVIIQINGQFYESGGMHGAWGGGGGVRRSPRRRRPTWRPSRRSCTPKVCSSPGWAGARGSAGAFGRGIGAVNGRLRPYGRPG